MNKLIFATILLLASTPLFSQTKALPITRPFKIALDSPTACTKLKSVYKTIINAPRNDLVEDLVIRSPNEHFPGAKLIQVNCIDAEIIILSVLIPKTRHDGADLAALYEELSRMYSLNLTQPNTSKGVIRSVFMAGAVRVELLDSPEQDFSVVTYYPR